MSIVPFLFLSLGCLCLAAVCVVLLFGVRFRRRLRRHPGFSPVKPQSSKVPQVTYAPADHPTLVELRHTYHLVEIAGSGPEIERFARLMTWVHKLTPRTPWATRPDRVNGLFLAREALRNGKRFNCWLYSIVLNDALLALGYSSRVVHLRLPDETPKESHVVVSVYSDDLETWILLDADMCAYVTDEAGTPLGVEEIRRRLIDRRPLRTSDSIRMAYVNWLGKTLVKRLYIWYLSKNIFRIDCHAQSEPDFETPLSGRTYLHLIPDGYHDDWLESSPRQTKQGNTIHYLRDSELFWQRPPSDRRP